MTGTVVAAAVVVGVVSYGERGEARREVAEQGPDPQYKLTVPRTLLDGTYVRARDLSGPLAEQAGAKGIDMQSRTAAGGEYVTAAGTDRKALLVTGLSGRTADPVHDRDELLSGASNAQATTLSIAAKEFTPADSSERVACEVLSTTRGSQVVSFPICGWGDNGTVATVMQTGSATTGSPDSVDLQACANLTSRVRAQVRVALR
ncbi:MULTISPECIES: hypothetical protein [Streptomycetaceae]|uniref:hypothetical protein n=1 Tax=Streptomycetaceae TaxID=2062 RepID=UPI001E5B34EF|nr:MULTISPECIES: hypothetical protein [Streptomycetaceae]